MRNRILDAHFALGVALTLAGLFFLDRPIAEYLRASGYEGAWLFDKGTQLLDLVTGKEISKFLLGGVFVGSGLILLAIPRGVPMGWATLFVGSVQLLSTLVAGVGKNFFGRLRPYQLLENGDGNNGWFADGGSFPSGHTGFYFGLFLPLAFLLPRWRWPLLLLPWFIALARIIANDHFLSDVATSIGLVAAITMLIAWPMRRRICQNPTKTPLHPGIAAKEA